MVRTPVFSLLGVCVCEHGEVGGGESTVRSPVGELKSHKPCSTATDPKQYRPGLR